MSDFGTGFKQARELLGISLKEIATETRISIRFLEAIESEEFQRLPGGVFNRGFIRAYAVRVGLDPDLALSQYDRLVRPEEAIIKTAPPRSERTRADIALYPIAVGALVLLIVGFYVLTRNSGSGSVTATQPTASAPASVPAPLSPTTSNILPNSSAETAGEAAPEAPPTPPQEQLLVEMTANQETWIRVLADGSQPSEEVLQAGDTRRFTAQESLAVTIGNAAGITLKVNDREVGALGRPGQVRAFVLTPANVAEIDKIIG